ncbi:protein FANTASTIC FOUR 4-like isoform X2 [Bidens hawaiensis]|uniref:protein FANTASTIC FOUR 4-like isoform X2 n=1 Tax=Bidens hawaiensis TaxID=980011 RepID=UPI00404B8B70
MALSFLKVLDNPSPDIKNLDQNDGLYVHPMVKRSASALSTKSLEMCTESLGSETGSEVSESGDEFCAISMLERKKMRESQRSTCRNFDRKIRRGDFPPPLTSISYSDGAVKVRHHREGGRLVIKAESVLNCGTNFQAERTNGRLKLSLLRECCVNYESEGGEAEVYESEGDDVESDEDEKEEEESGGWPRDMDGNRWLIGGDGSLSRFTRCHEGGNGNKVFANWGSSWVAIS